MAFSSDIEELLRKCIKDRLLEPLPGFILRPKGGKIKIKRPPTAIRDLDKYNNYREKMAEKLPEWVSRCHSQHAFYFKIHTLAKLIEELDVTQQLSAFMDQYDNGKLEPMASPPQDTAGTSNPQTEAEAAFAAAAAEGEASGNDDLSTDDSNVDEGTKPDEEAEPEEGSQAAVDDLLGSL